MSEINYKNQLQEYLQQHYRPLPRYETVGHDRAWRATVYVETMKFVSDVCVQKKDAEKAAARKALEWIHSRLAQQQQQRQSTVPAYRLQSFQQPPGTAQEPGAPDEGGDGAYDDVSERLAALSLPTAKNELQEHFQKRGLPLPTYEQRQHGLAGLWMSTVTITYAEKPMQIRSSKPWPQKVDADKDAAAQALRFLRTYPDVKPVYTPPERPSGVVLIDLESIPQVKLSTVAFPPEWWIVGFHSKLCTWPEAENLGAKMQLQKINDGHKDSADHLMTYWAAKVVCHTERLRKVVIVTRDHYGGALEVLLNADGKAARHVASVEEMMGAIRGL